MYIHTTEQLEVIDEGFCTRCGEVLAYSTSQEQDEHHRRGYPERPVQIRVALEHIEEVGPGKQRGPASLQHG